MVESPSRNPPRFYVYALIDPRKGKKGAVFYVGKGMCKNKGSYERNQVHLRDAINGTHCNPYLQNKIKKIVKAGLVYGVDFLFSTYNEQECLDKEMFYISLFGRKTLCNLTDGGDGTSGKILSDESKRRIGSGNKGNRLGPRSEESRRKQSESMKGHSVSEETRSKISQKNLGRKMSDESNRRNSLTHQGIKPTEDTRKKLSKSGTGRKHREESKVKMRIASTGKNHTEETKSKLRIANTGKTKNQETRKKMSESAKKAWVTRRELHVPVSEETREKIRLSLMGKTASEETRIKMSEAQLRRQREIRIEKNAGIVGKEVI